MTNRHAKSLDSESLSGGLGRKLLRMRLRTREFTIVSNNCWGAHIYQQLGRPYQTPFVGLFLTPSCYVKLVLGFRDYLEEPLRFTSRSRHEDINGLRERQGLDYPIGCLADVELQFLHYESKTEAAAKWARRVERVSRDDSRLYFKFCDRDGCTQSQLTAFDTAPVEHKVCFVARPMPHLQSAVWIPGLDSVHVPDGLALSRISPRFFDAAGWINGSNGEPRWWRPLRCA